MVYKRDLVKYTGKHFHSKGVSLAAEADMVQHNVLKSSGFFSGPGSGLNHGFGTQNPSMEQFITKWNNMNARQLVSKPLARGSTKYKFKGL